MLGKLVVFRGLVPQAISLMALGVCAKQAGDIVGFAIILGLLGVGMGMSMPNMTVVVQNSVQRHEIGTATGCMTFIRALGGTIGVATAGNIVATHLPQALLGQGEGIAEIALAGLEAINALPVADRILILDQYRDALSFVLFIFSSLLFGLG